MKPVSPLTDLAIVLGYLLLAIAIGAFAIWMWGGAQ